MPALFIFFNSAVFLAPRVSMSTAHLCIVRHGETDWNRHGILQGWTDIPLNAHGRQQAHALAAAWATTPFDAVWSSPLLRAHETAEIVATHLGLPPPRCHDGLKERCFGSVQGIPKSELAETNPVLIQQILKRNPATAFPEGEVMDVFADRVLHALREIGAHHPGRRVMVVTHGWTLDAILRHASGLPRHAILDRKRKNCECLWVQADARAVLPAPTFQSAWRT
jgi:probable phosphoglycerate mutase